MSQETFGYLGMWAKGTLKALETEYEFEDGLLLSGKLTIKEDQAKQLIEYLTSADYGQYGANLDIAVFYNSAKPVQFTGSLKTPYEKDSNKPASTVKATRKMK